MSSEVEAAGAAITAGLASAVIDKGGAHDGDAHGPCANCGAEMTGNYCSVCGQPTHIHRTLGHMVEEFLHGILHFDTRAWNTIPYLLFRPGTLTFDYIHGKRARFISPLAIFLLAVFTMFFVFSLTGGSQIGVGNVDNRITSLTKTAAQTTASLAEAEANVAMLESQTLPTDGNARASFDEKVQTARQRVSKLRDDLKNVERDLTNTNNAVAHVDGEPDTPAGAPESGAGVSGAAKGEAHDRTIYDVIREQAASGELSVKTGWPALDKKVQHKLENPELAVYKVQNTAYKLAFLLVPISLPFVWLLFAWKRGVTLFDHTVFILYSLSFVSLVFIAMSLVSMIPGALEYVGGWLTLALPVHIFFHLKGTYALGWFSAIWRTAVLILFAGISSVIFLLAIVGLGFVG